MMTQKIKEEFQKRWRAQLQIDDITFGDFVNYISLSGQDQEWWTTIEHMKNTYGHYLAGSLTVRYPEGMPVYPQEIWERLAEEIDEMIYFE